MEKLPPGLEAEIKALDLQCQALELDALAKGKELRSCEIRTVRTSLNGMLERPDLFSQKDIEAMISNDRKRIKDLESNPESMGSHALYVGMEFYPKKNKSG
jgi:hypothetical protein